jgi:prepilin peptidase dependent protein B
MKKQVAYTLIEIMIALLMGLILVGATISVYIVTVSSSSNIIKSARLNHDLDSIMTLMINDIKRAGYWGGATIAADSRKNPFTVIATTTTVTNFAPTNIAIMDFTDSEGALHANGCILYSYDADGDKHYDGYDKNADGDYVDADEVTPDGDLADATDDRNEFYGFRFNNRSIQMRTAGTTTDDCSNGEWEQFVDSDQVTITSLLFSFVDITAANLTATSRCLNVTTDVVFNSAACVGVASSNNIAENRVVNIQLAAKLKSEGNVIKSLNGTVEVRNNRLYLKP